MNTIFDALEQNEELKFPGFGSFKVTMLKARIARNPRNHQKIEVKAHKRVRFVPGKILRQKVNVKKLNSSS